MSSLLAIKHLAENTDSSFRIALSAMADRLGVDPNFLTPVMANESQFKPAATNPFSKATGLIQFMPSTANHLGTTVDDLRGMSAEDQLPYVEAYYKPFAGRIQSAGDAYMATFLPSKIGTSPDTILASDGEVIYTQNKGFDRDGKGYFTTGDVEAITEALYQAALSQPPIVDEDSGGSGLLPAALILGTALGIFWKHFTP